MPIIVEWDNPEHTVSLWTYQGHWTWEEFHNAQQIFNNSLGGITHPVDIIADMSQARGVPPCALRTYKREEMQFDPRRNRIIIAGCSSYMRSMAATINLSFTGNGSGFIFANTVEDARELLGYASMTLCEDRPDLHHTSKRTI